MNLKVLFKYSRIEKNLLAQAFKVRKFICFSVYFLDMDMCKYILFPNLNINSVQLLNPLTHQAAICPSLSYLFFTGLTTDDFTHQWRSSAVAKWVKLPTHKKYWVLVKMFGVGYYCI